MSLYINHLKTELLPIFNKYEKEIVAAYLFGSTVNGEMNVSSDIDIAVLRRNSGEANSFSLKLDLYADISRKLKRNDIDVVLLDLAGNLILNDAIIRHGYLLYSSDSHAREAFELDLIHRSIDFKFQRRFSIGI